MTSMKTVLLGSAAAILATGAAQAADLPVKKAAAAVQYVEVCPAFGRGFYRLPGGDICIRHFGSAKFGMGIQDPRDFISEATLAVTVPSAVSNTSGWQWTIRPGWDLRSPTPYGTLRTVVQLRVDQRAGIYESQNPNLIGAQRVNNMIQRGYIEWAGFVIGKVGSNFIYWDQGDIISAQGGSPKESIPFAVNYVFSAPGGLTATIGLEESSQYTQGFVDISAPGTVGLGPFRGMDVVGSLATEQSWGSAKVALLWHLAQTNNGTVRESDSAFAALAGVTFMLPTIGAGDQILFETTWCDGVIKACGGSGGGAANNATTFERSGQYLEGLQRTDVDAYLVTDGGTGWTFDKVKMWSVVGQFRHYWAPLWRSNLTATYSKINVPTSGETGTYTTGRRGDASVWDLGANLIWGKSRDTAEIGVEVIYKSLKQDLPSGTTAAAVPGDVSPKGWTANVFIQRAW